MGLFRAMREAGDLCRYKHDGACDFSRGWASGFPGIGISVRSRLSVVEPIDDHAISIIPMQRQGVAVLFVKMKRIYFALVLHSSCHSESLSYRD